MKQNQVIFLCFALFLKMGCTDVVADALVVPPDTDTQTRVQTDTNVDTDAQTDAQTDTDTNTQTDIDTMGVQLGDAIWACMYVSGGQNFCWQFVGAVWEDTDAVAEACYYANDPLLNFIEIIDYCPSLNLIGHCSVDAGWDDESTHFAYEPTVVPLQNFQNECELYIGGAWVLDQ